MFRKISSIIILSGLLLVGGVFQTTADASAGAENSYNKQENAKWQNVSADKWNDYLNKCLNKWLTTKWDGNYLSNKDTNKQEEQTEQPKEEPNAEVEQPEEIEEETPVQQEEQNEQTEEDTTNNSEQNDTTVDQLSAYEQEVVELTNAERAKQGLAPFQIDVELSGVAREKSSDMSVNNYFDHNSPTYGSPFDMMQSFGVNYQTAGENIAKGQRTPSEVVNAWMNSPGHRANILNSSFTHIGVGYVEQGNHWTQMFIGK